MCVDSERKTNTYKVMKVNAPEKLYFGESDKGILDIYSTKESDNEVEYIRTDAFIEKAAEWLDNNLWNYYDTGNIGDFETLRFEHFTQMIEDFRKYIKGVKYEP